MCVCVCVYVYMYVCIYACMYVFMYVSQLQPTLVDTPSWAFLPSVFSSVMGDKTEDQTGE